VIRFTASNLIERLTEALVQDVATHLESADPVQRVFQGTTVVVPNRETGTHLRRHLARHMGVTANIEFLLPGAFLARNAGTTATGRSRLVDRRSLAAWLLCQFADTEFMAQNALRPVAHYLHGSVPQLNSATKNRGNGARAVQLAQRLSHLFDAYQQHRPDLCKALLAHAQQQTHARQNARGQQTASPQHAALPGQAASRQAASQDTHDAETLRTWQALLLARARDQAAAQGRHFAYSSELERGSPFAGKRLFVFAPPPLSHSARQALIRLGQQNEVDLYQLHPCAEDPRVTNRAQLSFDSHNDPDADRLGIDAPGDPDLLRLWGRAGRESFTLLARARPAAPIRSIFGLRTDADTSALQALCADIATRSTQRQHTPRRKGDPSRETRSPDITWLACPGERREVESIAAQIWAFVRPNDQPPGKTSTRLSGPEMEASTDSEQAPCKFSDFAIAVPSVNRDAYHALITSVFAHAAIPYRIANASMKARNRAIRAVMQVVKLPGSAFSRQEILDLLLQPPVMAGFPEARPEDLRALCERLGIAIGKDAKDLQETYLPADQFNWDQGLERLALGVFMDPPAVPASHTTPQPLHLDPSAWDLAAGFANRVARLIDSARRLRTARMPFRQWVRSWEAVCTELMPPTMAPTTADATHMEDMTDEAVLESCFAELLALDELPLPGLLDHEVAAELACSALQDLTTTVSSDTREGVLVGALADLRGRSFHATFLCGLGVRAFPAPENRDEFDLRDKKRAGEPTPRDMDRFHVLEALLATRRRVFVSHVARNAATGERLEPSSTIGDLERFYATPYLDEPSRDAWKQTPALHRYDDPQAQQLFDASAKDALAIQLQSAAPKRDQAERRPAQHSDAESKPLEAKAAEANSGEMAAVYRKNDLAATLVAGWPQAARTQTAPVFGPSILTELSQEPSPELASEPSRTQHETPNETRLASGQLTQGPEPGQPSSLRLADVEAFLRCPLQGSARFHLGIRTPDDARATQALAVKDEPLTVAPDTARQALRECFTVASRRAQEAGRLVPCRDDLETAHTEIFNRLQAEGQLPVSVFGKDARRRREALMERWDRDLQSLAQLVTSSAEVHCFGRELSPHGRATQHPALKLLPESDTRERPEAAPLRIHHATQLLFESGTDRHLSLVLLPKANPPKSASKTKLARHLISGFMDHLALCLSRSPDAAARGHTLAISGAQAGQLFVHEFPPLQAADASHYIRDRLKELVAETHHYLLPCEAALELLIGRPRGRPRTLPQIIADEMDSPVAGGSCRFGLIGHAETYPPPDDARALALAQRRFTAFGVRL